MKALLLSLNLKMLPVHIACAIVVCFCLWVCTVPPVAAMPPLQATILTFAGGIWGKYGFVPSKRLRELIIQQLSPQEIVAIQSMKPPSPPPPPPAAKDAAPPTVPSA